MLAQRVFRRFINLSRNGQGHARSPEEVTEYFDAPEVLATKLDTLAEWVQASKHMIAFTGAGCSTCCIPRTICCCFIRLSCDMTQESAPLREFQTTGRAWTQF